MTSPYICNKRRIVIRGGGGQSLVSQALALAFPGSTIRRPHQDIYIVEYRCRRVAFDTQGHHIATGCAGEGNPLIDELKLSQDILRRADRVLGILSPRATRRLVIFAGRNI